MSDLAFSPGDRVRFRATDAMTIREWAKHIPLTPDGCLEVEGIIVGSSKASGFLAYAIDTWPLAVLPNQLTLLEAAATSDVVEPAPAIGESEQPKAAA